MLTGDLFIIVGECLTMLLSEVKHQKKLVRSLKNKSLWSKTLEEVSREEVADNTFDKTEELNAQKYRKS